MYINVILIMFVNNFTQISKVSSKRIFILLLHNSAFHCFPFFFLFFYLLPSDNERQENPLVFPRASDKVHQCESASPWCRRASGSRRAIIRGISSGQLARSSLHSLCPPGRSMLPRDEIPFPPRDREGQTRTRVCRWPRSLSSFVIGCVPGSATEARAPCRRTPPRAAASSFSCSDID